MRISIFNFKFQILLIFIVLLGGFFRFYAVNWDNFGAFHPDERNISWAVTRIRFFSQMNPKFFAYGGLPVYLYRALGELVVSATGNPLWLADWGHIAVVGRYVSATLSTVSILLIYLVGSVFFNEATGLASAAFLAFSPWAIREAHFQTTETMLVFFVLTIAYLSKKLFSKPTNGVAAAVGAVLGLALAAKTTSFLFGVIPAASLLLPIFKKQLYIGKMLILGAVAGGIFFLFSPYTIIDWSHFYESMTYESGVALGRFTVPYTLQFLHTTPYLYQIITMLWQAGPLVLVGLVGLVLLATRKKYVVFVIFPLLYFAWAGSWFAKFARYNVPFLPFVTIAAAWLLVKIKRPWITAFFFATTFIWCLMNVSIYTRPQTKIVASTWMYEHIPPVSRIYTEHWNDGLPVDIPGVRRASYNRMLLTVYDADGPKKITYLADMLSAGNYIVLSTRRIWATMPRMPEKYPITSRFYEQLLAGTLGYTEVATFTSYPSLFGWEIRDDLAEESIQVFDHPTVRIFENTQHFSQEKIAQLLSSKGN